MWKHVDLRELRAFLVLCEELHFGRTADRLGVSQSRVTQLIKRLETRLGEQLFERTSRRVVATQAGELLRVRLEPALGQLEAALRDARRQPQTITGVLRLGLLVPSSGGRALPSITDRFHRDHPACRCEIAEVSVQDGLQPLRAKDVDMVATRLPLEQPDITVGPVLTSDPRALAVALDHPLANRGSISLEEVADYPVADLSELYPPELIEAFTPSYTPSGRPIRRVPIRRTGPAGAMVAVARGELVHLTITTFKDYVNHPGYTLVPIDDMPRSDAGLVWLTDNESPGIRAFAETAEAVLSQAP